MRGSGKSVLLWMRGKRRTCDVLLDDAPGSVQARSAAEEALRAVSGGRLLSQCGTEIVGLALKRGAGAVEDVAAANGIPTKLAAKLLGF